MVENNKHLLGIRLKKMLIIYYAMIRLHSSIWLILMYCELNPWNSTIKNPEKPDWMVIDLDPEKVDFKKLTETAVTIKNTLDKLEIECLCKTSGSRGLHIFVPLGARYDYDAVKLFEKHIATYNKSTAARFHQHREAGSEKTAQNIS